MKNPDRQIMSVSDLQQTKRLKANLRGKVILPGDPEYDSNRMVWNGMINRHPALIAQCAGPGDVVQALRYARELNLEIAVRGGGHGVPGYATVDNGLVIDLSLMKGLVIDAQQQTALASSGLRLGEFIQSIQAHGLLTTVGTDPDTGLSGLTLGGGIGSLMGKFGLTCDNVRSFEMVTAAGEVVHANAAENPDLYWGLRGGGGNFGIVTNFEFQLHQASNVLGGIITHPISRAREVLQFYRDFLHQIPDELTVFSTLNNDSEGHPSVGFLVCYVGDLNAGEHVIEPLRKFGPPLVDLVQPMPYFDFLGWGHLPRGLRYYGKGGTLPELSDEVIDRLIEAALSKTSPLSQILIQHIHGVAARVAPDATAFSARGDCFIPFILSVWEGDSDQAHADWARKTWTSLEPFSSEAGYINFLGMEGQERVKSAYGGNYTRLAQLKRHYDPENIFKLNTNILPG
ncbi:MAG TPA: FAD-binding oxidoreductase [Longilinea sp.]|nr:FAD-binding oxidoreductase [Longilinea sp.]